MPSFVPSAATLLQAAADHLEREVLPALAGYPRFHTRVSINVLRTVMRELELGAPADAAEQARLQALLGDAPPSQPLPALRGELAARIASGALPLDDAALVTHLRETLRGALAIDNPRWVQEPP